MSNFFRSLSFRVGGEGQAASFPLRVKGRPFAPQKDLYHFVLRLPWSGFFGLVFLLYVAVNLLFAATYRLEPDCIAGVHDFESAFYFSVQTMATIGYGTFAPASRYGHVVVTFEAIVGVFATAMVTGLTFAKFARPTARVLFTEKMVIAPRNGEPHLMFRLANARHNSIVEAQLRVTLLVSETTREGETMRRQIDLPLLRPNTSLFALSWTAMHRIAPDSPFFGREALEALREKRAEVLLSLSGLDETIAQTIHARYRYTMDDLVEGAHFKDIIATDEDGTRVLDYAAFHEVVATTAPPENTIR
jgi:inward rectifier potassium channel